MEPTRVDKTLEEWKSVASEARRPAAPPRRSAVRSGVSTSTLAGASLAVAALVIAFLWVGGGGPNGSVGGSPSIRPDPTTTPASPTPSATMGLCDPANLSARITMWEGAAGHRIAHVDLTNVGSDACILPTVARPQLVDGGGSILIDGASPSTSEPLILAPGDVVTTLVQDGNYCGPAPDAPVTVAFDLGDGTRIVAAPFSPTDATVPPCLGSGSPATIEMQPWTR
jgi:uncharacterized protein DUF4232